MIPQKTVRGTARVSGVGLHTGAEVELEVDPAPPNSGVEFVRVDLPGSPRVAAKLANLGQRPRRTALIDGEAEVHTVEHLMATFCAMGIQNAVVRLNGPELPGLDGSSIQFYEALHEVGVEEQDAPAREIRVEQPLGLSDGKSSVAALPREGGGFRVSYTLEYDSPLVAMQHLSIDVDEETFVREIAPARTFVLLEEVEALQAAGLGKGATTQNTLVLGPDGILENELRFEDEFVRHKILDLIGDLYLTTSRIEGEVLATRSGHSLNVRLASLFSGALEASGEDFAPREGTIPPWEGTIPPREGTIPPREGTIPPWEGTIPPWEGTIPPWEGTIPPWEGYAPAQGFEPPLDIPAIRKLLPHRYPLLLVDRLDEVIGGRVARGVKSVTANEEFFQGHFPHRPVMPGVLIIEAMAQMGGLLLKSHEQNRESQAFLLSVDRVKFRKPVEPGDQLILESELKRMKPRSAHVSCRAFVDGKLASEAEIRYALMDSEG